MSSLHLMLEAQRDTLERREKGLIGILIIGGAHITAVGRRILYFTVVQYFYLFSGLPERERGKGHLYVLYPALPVMEVIALVPDYLNHHILS